MERRKLTRYAIENACNAKASMLPGCIQNCSKSEEKFNVVENLARDLKRHFTKKRVAKEKWP